MLYKLSALTTSNLAAIFCLASGYRDLLTSGYCHTNLVTGWLVGFAVCWRAALCAKNKISEQISNQDKSKSQTVTPRTQSVTGVNSCDPWLTGVTNLGLQLVSLQV